MPDAKNAQRVPMAAALFVIAAGSAYRLADQHGFQVAEVSSP